jgi:hypothetical protein
MFSTKLLNKHEQQIVTAHTQFRRNSQLIAAAQKGNNNSNINNQSKYGVKYKSSRSISLHNNLKQTDSVKKMSMTPTSAVPAPQAVHRFHSFRTAKLLDAGAKHATGAGNGSVNKTRKSLEGSRKGRSASNVRNGGSVSASAGRTSFRIGGPKTNSVSRRVTKMVIFVSLVFLMLNLPIHLYNIFISVRVYCDRNPDLTVWEAFANEITQAIFYTSFSCNFLLYSISGATFRTEITRLFLRPFCSQTSKIR